MAMLTIERGNTSADFTISGNQDDDNAMDDEVTLTLSKDEDTYNVVLGNPRHRHHHRRRGSQLPALRSPLLQ